jgi:phenylalanyl-tRNA synthetase alpha chain
MELTNGERKIIKYLRGKGYVGTDELFKIFDKNEVTSSISWLREKKIINVLEKPITYFTIGSEGERVLSSGLPEEKLLKFYISGKRNTVDLERAMGDDLRYGLAQVFRNGGKVVSGELVLDGDQKLQEHISKTKKALEMAREGKLSESDAQLLKPRKGFVNEKVRMERTVKLTAVGEQIAPEALEESDEINQITPEIIENFNEAMNLRPYDPTLYAPRYLPGKVHPLSEFIEEVRQVMLEMGFKELKGQIVESAFWNMDMLFIPQNHSARDMQDTFWIVPGEILLRTQTSSVQIRFMQEHQPPIRIVVPGKVFRNEDNNATHGAMFHQIEGLLVDKMCTMSDLHGCLERFVHEMFGADRNMRMRGSYFPFTEPSAEVDLSCVCCGNDKACRICKGSGWSEILGCGMVHPNVLREVGYDPQEYRGFAFGMGMDRIAILKYGIDKIGRFTENDLRFLQQF